MAGGFTRKWKVLNWIPTFLFCHSSEGRNPVFHILYPPPRAKRGNPPPLVTSRRVMRLDVAIRLKASILPLGIAAVRKINGIITPGFPPSYFVIPPKAGTQFFIFFIHHLEEDR